MLLVVKNILCVFETVVAAVRAVIVLWGAFEIGHTPADDGEFDAGACEIWLKLPELIQAD